MATPSRNIAGNADNLTEESQSTNNNLNLPSGGEGTVSIVENMGSAGDATVDGDLLDSNGSPTPADRKRRSDDMNRSVSIGDDLSGSPASTTDADTKKPRWDVSLAYLCHTKSWEEARVRALNNPGEASYGWSASTTLLELNDDTMDSSSNNTALSWSQALAMASSPLALSCRYGAPPETVKAILNANKNMVRRCIPNRGTPLHEAIMTCGYSTNMQHEMQYVKVMRMLLRADEELEIQLPDRKRAALMQDVDGNVPLHLLVRQAFYSYLGNMSEPISSGVEVASTDAQKSGEFAEHHSDEHPFMTILRDLVLSCPDAVAVPDFGSYEETPLVQALKSSVYVNERAGFNVNQRDEHMLHGNDMRLERNANPDENNESSDVHLERRIFNICKLMLASNPAAASQVVAQSGYTALHSAVFHGRCSDTVRLVVNADLENRRSRKPSVLNRGIRQTEPRFSNSTAAMKANSLGELPLHFAAMRGECTRSIALLSEVSPEAVLHRDSNSLSPLHWLMIRWVDTMIDRFGTPAKKRDTDEFYATEDGQNATGCLLMTSQALASYNNARQDSTCKASSSNSSYTSSIDKELNFDLEYLVRTNAIDPPVDYRRMRHISPTHKEIEYQLVDHAISVLRRVRSRHRDMMKSTKESGNAVCPYSKVNRSNFMQAISCIDSITRCPFVNDSYPVSEIMTFDHEEVREEQAICLFWAKVTSLLHAAAVATRMCDQEDILASQGALVVDEDKLFMLHTACAVSCSTEAIVRLCMGLYPEQLEKRDFTGKLALHHAACRLINKDEFGSDDGDFNHSAVGVANVGDTVTANEVNGTTSMLIENETHKIVQMIIEGSAPMAARACDHEYRLPLHYAIESVIKSIATYHGLPKSDMSYLSSIISYLESFISMFPESLSRRDGRTGLYPFMQAAVGQSMEHENDRQDETPSSFSSRPKIDYNEDVSLSIVYYLLKDNPSLVTQHQH